MKRIKIGLWALFFLLFLVPNALGSANLPSSLAYSANSSNVAFVGSTVDAPSGVTLNVDTSFPRTYQQNIQDAANLLAQNKTVVTLGGTGGSISAEMTRSIINLAGQINPNHTGAILNLGGADSTATQSLVNSWMSGQYSFNPPTGLGSTAAIPSYTNSGVLQNGDYNNYLANGMANGSSGYGTGNYNSGVGWTSFPSKPVYVPVTPPPPPPLPSITGSISPTTGHPGQTLTLTAQLGYATTSGSAKDTMGSNVSIPSSGSFTYTIPSNAKIGQYIEVTFYSSNQWYTNIFGNNVEISVENPMSMNASANPTTLAPTEWSALSASTTGYTNKVSAVAKPIQIDGTKNTIASGASHTLAIRSDNTVWSAGDNSYGQLGNGTTTQSKLAVQVQGLSNIVSVSAGESHSLALKSDGTVWAWGRGTEGELGNGSTANSSSPIKIQGLTNVVAISSGAYHNLALKKDGTLWAWGRGTEGELGNGLTANRSIPVQVINIPNITAIGTGYKHSLAVAFDGSAWAFGNNNKGQLGDNTTTNSSVPVQVIGVTNAKTISGGIDHSVIQETDNSFWAFGGNSYGQLGTGNTTDSHIPVLMNGRAGYSSGYSIIAGGYHTLSIGTDNQIYSVGYGGDGQLGNGTFTSSSVWVSTGLKNALRIGSGCYSRTSLAITGDNYAHVWGSNASGQFATMTSANSNVPVDYANTNSIATVSRSIALKSDGTIWDLTTATQITDITDVISISMTSTSGWYAVQSNGTLWHHTPADTVSDNYIPAKTTIVPGISNAVEVCADMSTPIVRKSDGTVWILNYGYPGLIPTQIAIDNVVSIAEGYDCYFAIKSDGTVWYWGQLGRWNGNRTVYYLPNVSVPTQITGLSNIVQVSGGYCDAMFLDKNGTVYSLGAKTFGNGITTFQYMTPTPLSLPKIVSILNLGNNIAIGANGKQYTWGILGSASGQGAVIYTPTPTTELYYPTDRQYSNEPGGPPLTGLIKATSGGYIMQNGNILRSQYTQFGGEYFADGSKHFGFWPTFLGVYNFNLYSQSVSYSVGNTSAYAPITVNFTADDGSYPSSNNWHGNIQIPVNAPIYSQYILTVTAQSPWLNNSNSKPQTVSNIIVLNVQNTIKLSQPIASKTQVSPGDTITITVPNSSGYALAVKATGPNPAGGIVQSNLTPMTSISTIPKLNSWTGTFTIPANAKEGAYPITFVGSNTTFINQANSSPVYLNITVGSPPITIKDESATINNTDGTAYSHRPTGNLIDVNDINGLYAYDSNDSKSTQAVQQSDGFWRVPRQTNGYNNTEILMNKNYPVLEGQQVTESFYYKSDSSAASFQISFLTWDSGLSNPAHHPVTPTITDLGNGLKKATATYAVGSGESYIRAIDLTNLSDDWNYLDIANAQLNIPDQNIVMVNAITTGIVDHVTISVSGQIKTNGVVSNYSIALPNMLSSDNTNWSLNYLVPDNAPEGTSLTFTLNAVASNGYTYGPVYVSAPVSRFLKTSGHLSTQAAAPGQTIPIDAITNGYASAVAVTDNYGSSTNLSVYPSSEAIDSAGNMLTGTYTIPASARIGQTITLTFNPTDTNNGTTFIGQPDQKTITVGNTPEIKSVNFVQDSPYPGNITGVPTGQVDAIITTAGYVTSLNVSWDTSYSIAASSYTDLDSNGNRQWLVKNLTVPITADVSNATPTLLHIKGQTPFIDQATGSRQVTTGVGVLKIDNTITVKAQQLSNPVVTPGTPFTITVASTGYATQVFAKNIDGSTVSLTPSASVNPSIPFENSWTGTITIPAGTSNQLYLMPVWGTNTTFVNQPQSSYDYISLNIGGIPNLFSASLDPYVINLPAATDADRTVTMYAQTTGPVSGVQVSLSINGGTPMVLPTDTMQITSGAAPGLVSWQGPYLVDPATQDGTILTFSFQALDSNGVPTGQILTPPSVTVHQNKPPKVIITG